MKVLKIALLFSNFIAKKLALKFSYFHLQLGYQQIKTMPKYKITFKCSYYGFILLSSTFWHIFLKNKTKTI